MNFPFDFSAGARSPRRRSPRFALACTCAALVSFGRAQTRPSESAQTITLNPFEVRADSDTSYGALNSNSITVFNTALDHLPVSADILNEAFMDDIAGTSVEAMISGYSAGTGPSGLSAGASAAQNQPGDRVNQSYMQMRGAMTPNTQRDSLLFLGTLGNPGGTSPGYTNNFDIERVELIQGPNALLYDGGGAGGVINLVSKQARIGGTNFGSVTFRTDQWGSKYALLDYGTSRGKFAVRVALLNTTDNTRRINIGSHISGTYVQFAGRLNNTTIRLSLEQTFDWRLNPAYDSLTSTGDPAFAAQNSYSLGYLLASHQAGRIDNGLLNWSNINSLHGFINADSTVAGFATLSADTRWTSWLSTRLAAGISEFTDDHFMDVGPIAFYSPNASANPLPGNWTMGMTGAFSASDGVRPYHGQGLRFSALLTNDLFGGRAKSQSTVGIDTVDNRGGIIQYAYYQADGNWNIITNPSVTANAGRTLLPKLAWSVNDGPVACPLFRLGTPRITWNGVNYVRAMENPFSTARVSPSNPLGTALVNGPNGLRNDDINTGIYGVNYTQWLDGKLDSLAGVRLEHAYTYTARPQLSPPTATPVELIESHNFNFNAGADYHVLPWLAPYFSVSESNLLAPNLQNDPYGEPLPVSRALGEEVGLKINSPSHAVSGSVALYRVTAKNEEFAMNTSLMNDINPTGLNGKFDSDATAEYAANARSRGVEVTLTAAPDKNWRLRLSAAFTDGRIESSKTYAPLYNDQFFTNGQGQVTYADGSVVFVTPVFSAKPVDATTSGAIPLTVAAMSTPGNAYFASPVAGSGAIQSSSNAAKILQTSDPRHGAILTGATGLPISAYQLNSALTGVPVPSAIPVANAGESTTGYPEYSVNLTAHYTVPSGWWRGVEIGGTASAGWNYRNYYYYPTSLTATGANAQRSLFATPVQARFDLILGYRKKFSRVTFSTQLNVSNVFNHYNVTIYPDLVTGWTNPSTLNANFNQQPRSWIWTNRISF